MSKDLNLFPTLTDEMKAKIRFQASSYMYSYFRDSTKQQLQDESIDGSSMVYKICDEKGIWSPDNYNLIIARQYTLKTFSCLFGSEGIACRNAELGIAVIWTSTTSKLRGVIEVGSITNNEQTEVCLEMENVFEVAELRGSVELTTIIYLKRSGNPNSNENHLANTEGYILGELDKIVIMLDGSGSVFPIYEVNEPNQPLWYIKCDWEDPTYDLFAECVSININTAHPNYKYLDRTKRAYDEQLLKEIISSALMIIIMKLKDSDYWVQTINREGLEVGSVSEAVSYFITTLGWETTSIEALAISIRKFFDNRM